MHTIQTRTESPLIVERPTERDPHRVSLIGRKKGVWSDRRKDANRKACRGRIEQ